MAGSIKFTGKYGLIGSAAALLLIAYRVATLDTLEDPALADLLRAELAKEAGIEADAEALVARVRIDSIKASSPLLPTSSSPRVVLKVDYEIVDDGVNVAEGVRYFRARHQRHTRSWRLGSSRPSALSYYMNFL